MNHKADPMARGMAELFSPACFFDRGPGCPVDSGAGYAGTNSMNSVLLRMQDQSMDLALTRVRTAHAHRPRDIAIIAIRLGTEIDCHEVASTKPPA
jgi:hypothetical protein